MSARNILLILIVGVVAAYAGAHLSRFGAYLAYSVAIASIGAMALNLLSGICGQISFSQAALMGVGAYTAGNFGNAGYGGLGLLLGGLLASLASVVIGLPSLRLRGLYFAISTIATQFLFEYAFKTLEPLTNGVSGLTILPLKIAGYDYGSDSALAALCIFGAALTYLVMSSVRESDLGRAFRVVRENEIVARGMGLDVAKTKLWAFAISGFFAGIAGGLSAFSVRLASPESFNLPLSIDYVAMTIVGGLGSLPGSLLGAAFVTLLPEAIQRAGEAFNIPDILSALRELTFGVLMVIFLIFEPRGLSSLLQGLRRGGARTVKSSN